MSKVFIAVFLSILVIAVTHAYAQNQTQTQGWSTYEDPILQFSIEYPSTWNITAEEDKVSFETPVPLQFFIITEPLSTLDPSEYARENINSIRTSDTKIISMNEITINGHPASRVQFNWVRQNITLTTLVYFMVTDDYTGYALTSMTGDFDFTKHLPTIERMVNSFNITKVAKEEVDSAKSALANLQEYGCENPTTTSGPSGSIVYCPESPEQWQRR